MNFCPGSFGFGGGGGGAAAFFLAAAKADDEAETAIATASKSATFRIG